MAANAHFEVCRWASMRIFTLHVEEEYGFAIPHPFNIRQLLRHQSTLVGIKERSLSLTVEMVLQEW